MSTKLQAKTSPGPQAKGKDKQPLGSQAKVLGPQAKALLALEMGSLALYARECGADAYPKLIAYLDGHENELRRAIEAGTVPAFLAGIPGGNVHVNPDTEDPQLVATVKGYGFVARDPRREAHVGSLAGAMAQQA